MPPLSLGKNSTSVFGDGWKLVSTISLDLKKSLALGCSKYARKARILASCAMMSIGCVDASISRTIGSKMATSSDIFSPKRSTNMTSGVEMCGVGNESRMERKRKEVDRLAACQHVD